jgi:RHS repeat-associated protein
VADLPASVTYPTGRIVSYTRDALGRVTAVSQKDNAAAAVRTVADTITWQPFGALAGLRHANSVELAFTYDLDSRLTRILATGGATTFLDLNYTWDNADNITAISDGRAPAQSQSFGYDTLDRLISGTGAYGAWTYGYSANSNRTARSKSGGVSETYTTTSGSNRLASVSDGSNTRSLTYDGAGNITGDSRSPSQTFTYVYDKAGRLTEVQLASQTWALYQLNALGERVAKTIPGTPDQVTHFHYDLDGRLIAETDGAGTMLREVIWLDELPVMFRSGAAEYAVVTDHLATPNRLVDLAGTVVWDAVWRPFGELESLTATVTFPLRLPGQYFDAETGLHYNYQRDYDPALGRYIQSDPIGLDGGANWYEYAGGNPLRFSDPTGEFYQLFFREVVRRGAPVVGGFIKRFMARLAPAARNAALAAGTNATIQYATTGCIDPNQVLLAAASGALPVFAPKNAATQAVLPKPKVSDPKLQNYVDALYKGSTNPKRVGNGTTMDAIRHELANPGQKVHGRTHVQKGTDIAKGLSNWLQKNPNASYGDKLAAQSLLNELKSVLKGGP